MITSTPGSMAALLPLAADVLVKATVLLLVAALAAHALRRRSAALRHLLWTLAIVGIAVLPALTSLVPFRLRVLPAATSSSLERGNEVARRSGVQSTDRQRAATQSAPLEPTALERERPISAESSSSVDLATVVVSIWLIGTLILLGRFALGLIVVRRIARRARVVSGESWHALVGRCAKSLGIRSPVEFKQSDQVAMPFACGLIKPTIVLPTSSAQWSAERREAVLMHEFAHISRGDLAMNTLSHFVRALYWFHPLAWLAAYRLRVEGERACDDAVLRAGARPSAYAEHLLSIVRTVGNTVPKVALAMARRSDFEGRLLAILEPGIPRDRLTRWRAAGVAALFLFAVMPLAAMAPADNTAPPATTVQEARPAPPASARTPSGTESQAPGGRESRTPLPVQQNPQQATSVVTALIETLTDANAVVRIAAANSLGTLGDPRAIAALAKALREDTDARVREAAAHALGDIDDPRAVGPLLDALKTERAPNVREKIVHALGEIDDPSAVAGISAVLKDPSVAVRRAAVSALGELEDPSAVPALLTMVRDEDAEVRKHTAEALGQLENTSAIDALAQLSRDANADVRVHAISALGSLEDQRALPALVTALKDANADVRAHAADAIDDLDGLETAPPALMEALSDPNREVRKSAANSLGSIGDPAAVPPLKRLTTDTDNEVRRAAVEALSEIGGAEAIQAIMGLIKDPDPEIRRIVAEALGSKRH
jgi:HEAT repeat protein/beta-lactamase regulating signal transducer with metallopeptidase domain